MVVKGSNGCLTAMLVLTIPHSNTDEERVFSMVMKNKTPFCQSLALDTTLPSLLTVKLATKKPCLNLILQLWQEQPRSHGNTKNTGNLNHTNINFAQ